jgi:hypothetical protein
MKTKESIKNYIASELVIGVIDDNLLAQIDDIVLVPEKLAPNEAISSIVEKKLSRVE